MSSVDFRLATDHLCQSKAAQPAWSVSAPAMIVDKAITLIGRFCVKSGVGVEKLRDLSDLSGP